MTRRILVFLAMPLFVLVLPLAAWADGAQSPQSGGPLDIKSVDESSNGVEIKYRVEFYEPWDAAQVTAIRFDFDFDSDGQGDACLFLNRATKGGLEGGLYHDCGQELDGTAVVDRVGPTALVATIQRASLSVAGLKKRQRLAYRVLARSGTHRDETPAGANDWISQELNGPMAPLPPPEQAVVEPGDDVGSRNRPQAAGTAAGGSSASGSTVAAGGQAGRALAAAPVRIFRSVGGATVVVLIAPLGVLAVLAARRRRKPG